MKKLFPKMTSRIGSGYVFAAFAYWLFGFVLLPFVIPIVGYGAWDDTKLLSWVEGIYHVINGSVMAFMLKEHMSDTAYKVRLKFKNFVSTVMAAIGMMTIVTVLADMLLKLLNIRDISTVDIYPISEFDVAETAGLLILENNIFGTISISIFSTFAITGMFYASGFAPLCCKRPWLGYVMVTVLLVLVTGFDIFWRGYHYTTLLIALLRLPIHLIACWSYQKENSVWAPLSSLFLFNLVTSLWGIFAYNFPSML